MNPAKQQRLSVLIPDGDTWDSVKVLRCLGPAFKSYVVSEQKRPLSKFSRLCQGHYFHIDSEDRLNGIKELIAELKIDVLFPILEKAIEFVIQHQTALSGVVALARLPSIEAFHTVCDKSLFHNVCLKNDLPVPPSLILDKDPENGKGKFTDIDLTYPMLLKPVEKTGGGRGIIKIKSDSERLTAMKGVHQAGKSHILQSYITGVDLCLCAYCQNGSMRSYTIQRSLSFRDDYFGPQRIMDFIDDTRVVETCAKLISLMRWEGMICIDLRIDSRDDSIKFLEVNPRLGQAVLGSLSSGINFPIIACLDAKGMNIPDMTYRPTRYYHPRESWKMLLPGHNNLFFTGLRHTGLRYSIADPLPDLVDLVRRLYSRVSKYGNRPQRSP